MNCDQDGCKNRTCNIYDTKVTGECREISTVIVPDEPVTSQSTTTSKLTVPQIEVHTIAPEALPTKVPELDSIPMVAKDSNEQEVERPLELEAVLSSTVNTTLEKS